ncbi:MAG: hypothetical protein ACR2NU_10100 [Aeoliella sp.]
MSHLDSAFDSGESIGTLRHLYWSGNLIADDSNLGGDLRRAQPMLAGRGQATSPAPNQNVQFQVLGLFQLAGNYPAARNGRSTSIGFTRRP